MTTSCSVLLHFLALNLVNIAYSAFPNGYPRIQQEEIVGDTGEPLFITPLIDENLINEARSAAEVNFTDFKSTVSYSGYFTVDKNFNSNLFFWFFPSENNYENDPVLLWLQGGPGTTSLMGLFAENGPFIVNKDNVLDSRQYSWTKSHSVIYIDNPVGTGYSFTGSTDGYARNETIIGENLYEALRQFYTLFPELQKNDFFVTGESYAGKYIPALAYTILKKNALVSNQLKINLKGICIGNGLVDPATQLKYAEYLYQVGLVDANGRDEILNLEKQAHGFIIKQDYANASRIFNEFIMGGFGLNENQTLLFNLTGFVNHYNYLHPQNPISTETTLMGKYIQRVKVRAAIHVGNSTFNDGLTVEDLLFEDVTQSVATLLPELLDNYRVLFYSGQLDIILAYPMTASFLQQLNFTSAEEYKVAPRKLWTIGDELAGYAKVAGNLTEVLVRSAGHMVPSDQPKWAYDMVYKFVRNIELGD